MDPAADDFTQKYNEWFTIPRINLPNPNIIDAEIDEHVQKGRVDFLKTHRRPAILIVHEVPQLAEYDKHVKVGVDLGLRELGISASMMHDFANFRDHLPDAESPSIAFTEGGGIELSQVGETWFPKELAERTQSMINAIIGFCKKTGHERFETSFVTYLREPAMPEFYDLIFGKGILPADYKKKGE